VFFVTSILIEAVLLSWVIWVAWQWGAGSRAECQIGPASATLPYCRSFWAVGGPWALASAVIPVGWAAVAIRRQRRR
jgi:hypothetical protein